MSAARKAAGLTRYVSLADRLAARVIPEPMSGCHLWIGSVNRKGYGSIRINGKTRRAHQAAWIVAYGPIPAGSMVLHSCDNPACVNPLHLHLGDAFMNMREMVARGRSPHAKKTHCPKGHSYSPENTRYKTDRNSRLCRTCQCDASRRRHEANRALRADTYREVSL